MVCALLLAPALLVLSLQEPFVTGARVGLKLRHEPALHVTLVNEHGSAVVHPPNVVASVESLRDVRIEAFGFEVLKPDSSQPESGMSMRLCPSQPGEGRPDHGFIRAGEIREVPIGRQPLPDAPLPPVRLRFVLYTDGSLEGHAFDRHELLRQRPCGPDR
jgi:hypothetical protein